MPMSFHILESASAPFFTERVAFAAMRKDRTEIHP